VKVPVDVVKLLLTSIPAVQPVTAVFAALGMLWALVLVANTFASEFPFRVVKVPAAGVVPPMAGGEAKYVLNPVPLTVLLADNVVKAPVDAVVDPIGPGAANVAPPSCAALTDVLQVNPVPAVQFSELDDVLQLGMANAVGLAPEPVTFATTVFEACAASAVTATLPHAGADVGPVDRMT
jgi:hypothetical protein